MDSDYPFVIFKFSSLLLSHIFSKHFSTFKMYDCVGYLHVHYNLVYFMQFCKFIIKNNNII